MTDPVCMAAPAQKDGIATFATALKPVLQGQHVEMVIYFALDFICFVLLIVAGRVIAQYTGRVVNICS
jgi:hypothetical protein